MNTDPAKNEREGFEAEFSRPIVLFKNPPDSGLSMQITSIGGVPVTFACLRPGEQIDVSAFPGNAQTMSITWVEVRVPSGQK